MSRVGFEPTIPVSERSEGNEFCWYCWTELAQYSPQWRFSFSFFGGGGDVSKCREETAILNKVKTFMLTVLAALARLTLLKTEIKVFCLTFVVQWYSIHWNTAAPIG
jgi:hypothetical protein